METIIEKIKKIIEKQLDALEENPLMATVKIVFICWILIVVFRKISGDKK